MFISIFMNKENKNQKYKMNTDNDNNEDIFYYNKSQIDNIISKDFMQNDTNNEDVISNINKIAVVTGGTRGIGAGIAAALKEDGYLVIANYKDNDEEAEEFANQHNQIKSKGYILTQKWDVSNFEECEANINEILKKYNKIDVLINNAGITRDSMMHKMQSKDWLDVINTNLTSCFNMSRAVINKMRDNNYGRIVNLSSVNALSGQLGQVNYSASKAGIIGLTKSLAKETASKGITVNCVAPGYVDTQMTQVIPPDIKAKIIEQIPVKRFAKIEEIVNAVLFLVNDTGYITGSVLSINGGLYM